MSRNIGIKKANMLKNGYFREMNEKKRINTKITVILFINILKWILLNIKMEMRLLDVGFTFEIFDI